MTIRTTILVLLALAQLSSAATTYLMSRKDEGNTSVLEISAAPSALFGLDASGQPVMVPNSTFMQADVTGTWTAAQTFTEGLVVSGPSGLSATLGSFSNLLEANGGLSVQGIAAIYGGLTVAGETIHTGTATFSYEGASAQVHRDALGLGTAALTDSAAYATAEQGAKAASALQNGSDVATALGYTPMDATGSNIQDTDAFLDTIGAMSDSVDFYADFTGWANGTPIVPGVTRPEVGGSPWARAAADETTFYAAAVSQGTGFARGTGLRVGDGTLGYLGSPFVPSRGGASVPLEKRKFTMAWELAFEPPSAAFNPKNTLVTVFHGSPTRVAWTNHGLRVGWPVIFSNYDASSTGLTPGVTYYVKSVPTPSTFELTESLRNGVLGPTVNTTGGTSVFRFNYAGPIFHNGVTLAVSPKELLHPDGNAIRVPLEMLHIECDIGGVKKFGINTRDGSVAFRVVPPYNTTDTSWFGAGSFPAYGQYVLILEVEGDEARLSMGGRTIVYRDSGLSNYLGVDGDYPGIGDCIGGNWWIEYAGDSITNLTSGINTPYQEVVKLLRVWSSSKLNRTPGYGITQGSAAQLLSMSPVLSGSLTVLGNNRGISFPGPSAYAIRTEGNVFSSNGVFSATPFAAQGYNEMGTSPLVLNTQHLLNPASWDGTDGSTLVTLGEVPLGSAGESLDYVLRGNLANGHTKRIYVRQPGASGNILDTGDITDTGRYEIRMTRQKTATQERHWTVTFETENRRIMQAKTGTYAGVVAYSVIVDGATAGDVTADFRRVTANLKRE